MIIRISHGSRPRVAQRMMASKSTGNDQRSLMNKSIFILLRIINQHKE
jgi:hypothetical protein